MRLPTTIVVAALVCVPVQAQTAMGVLAGTVRDSGGGVIPGARVFVQTGSSRQQTVSDSSGRYRLELPAGSYRVEAQLAGFRPTVVESVAVSSTKQVQCDLILRLGILPIVDYVVFGLAESVPKADVVAHVRVVRSGSTQLVGDDRNILAIEHEVAILTLVKGDRLGLKPGPARFLQENAGVWIEEGRRHIGQDPPYKAGDEFVALLRREPDGRLREFSGRHLTFPVAAGRVSQQGGPIPGFINGITLEDFLEVLRKLS
jgi:hypothetical protein